MSHLEQKFSVNSTLYAALALRQHAVNTAAGINRVTPQVGLFLALYNRQRAKEVAAMPIDEKLLAYVNRLKSDIDELAGKAKETTDPEQQREYLGQAQGLHVQIIEAVNLMREWANE